MHEHEILHNIFKHLQKIGLTDHGFGDLDIKIGVSLLLRKARPNCVTSGRVTLFSAACLKMASW